MIEVKSPTRVDLSGGTLDMWPLYTFVGECKTINVAIDIWTKAKIELSNKLIIQSDDYKQEWNFANYGEFMQSSDSRLDLYKAVLRYFKPESTACFKLTTLSESPIGGGLGGSSSLVISLLKAFGQFFKHSFKDVHHMVYVAHNIEAEILNTPTGTQDYYPAALGGMNVITYSTDGIQCDVISDERLKVLSDFFLLAYTGKSHHSGLNNFEVLKSAVAKESTVFSALKSIKRISDDMYKLIQNSQWTDLPSLFKREMDSRIQLTDAFTSPEIKKLEEIALVNGALGVKICGAGGGGCVLIWVAPEHRERVIDACEKSGYRCLKSKPVQKL